MRTRYNRKNKPACAYTPSLNEELGQVNLTFPDMRKLLLAPHFLLHWHSHKEACTGFPWLSWFSEGGWLHPGWLKWLACYLAPRSLDSIPKVGNVLKKDSLPH
ncbi:hypothetical protein VNO77_03280 [Canavalia gladiata]|uniref:Uncharacterized protein n=1 Tax=Canavalia gladiata TaxID=3824 RepID=A0AAN9R6P2_CANGL